MQHIKRSKNFCYKCFLGTVLYIFIVLFLLFVIIFVLIPVVFKYSVGFQRSLVFPVWVIPPNSNYSDVKSFGIQGVKNFYVTVNDYSTKNESIRLGVWQILPLEIVSDLIENDDYNYDGILSDNKYNVLLYLHGNGNDRAANVEKYLHLRKYFHIFAIDYRSYGDSTKAELTETNVINDTVQVYEWLRARTTSKIFVWGHSIGTAISTHMLSDLKMKNVTAKGLVLETPFTSVTDLVASNTLVKTFFSWLPWFNATMIQPMIDNDFNFNSKEYILDVDCPIMILHAKDDTVVPYKYATELYRTVVANRNSTYQGNVTYHLFDAVGYDHMYITRAPEIPGFINNFLKECDDFEISQSMYKI